MAADLDQAYLRWSREGISDPAHPLASSISEMLNHGSISFGRYAVESLSWEKRSVFTHDRCQEELEKFKAPGLVAKKKAYFEEYYKRMRLLKSSTNKGQQMEVMLDHGADSCISSQTGEDDESAMQSRDPREDDSITCLGNGFVEMTIEHKQICNSTPSLEQMSSQPSVSCDLSSEFPSEINLEKDFSDASQVMCVDVDADLGNSIEILDVKNTDKISSGDFETTNVDIDSTMPHINTQERSIKEMDVKRNSDVSQLKHESGCKVTTMDLSEGRRLPGSTAHGDKPDKAKVPANKNMEHVCNHKRKDCSASTRALLRPGNKIKSEQIMPSLTSYSHRKRVGNRGSIVNPIKGSSVPRNNKISSFSTGEPNKLHPTVTISCPFSFTTGKHYTVGKRPDTDLHESGDKHLNSKPKIKFTSSLHANRGFPSQNTSKNCTASTSMKSVNLEKNGHQEGLYAKSSCTNNHLINLKGRDGLTDRPQPWSVSLPAADRSHCNSRPRSGAGIIVGEDTKEGKTTVRQTGSQGISVPSTSSAVRKAKLEVQQVYSQIVDVHKIISQKSRKIVVNEKKPRQEVKRWR